MRIRLRDVQLYYRLTYCIDTELIKPLATTAIVIIFLLFAGALTVSAATLPITSDGSLGFFNPAEDVVFNTSAGTFQIGSNISTGGRTVTVNSNNTPVNVTVFDFTSINIPDGVTIRAVGDIPLILLAQTNVTVNGTINLSGKQGGNAGLLGGGGGGAGGGAVAIFADSIIVGQTGQVLARGGDGGLSVAGGNITQGGSEGLGEAGGGSGGSGGSSVAGGAGGSGGSASVLWRAIFLGGGGGGGGGGAYSGAFGPFGPGIPNGNNGGIGAAGLCNATVAGGAGGAGGGGLFPINVGGAGGAAGAPAGGAGGAGLAGAVIGGGGGGGGGATLGGAGGPGGPGAGFAGGGGGGGGADSCKGGPPAGAGGPAGPGGAGGIFGVTPGFPAIKGGNGNMMQLQVNKTGAAGGGGIINLGAASDSIQNLGLLSVSGGLASGQQGGSGVVAIFGILNNSGTINGTENGTIYNSSGQTADQWAIAGGGGGGGAGGNGLIVAARPTEITDNITGILLVNQSTSNILAQDYMNFNASNPYNITITRLEDDQIVYTTNGTLTGDTKQTISINWTPTTMGDYLLQSESNTTAGIGVVTVINQKIIFISGY